LRDIKEKKDSPEEKAMKGEKLETKGILDKRSQRPEETRQKENQRAKTRGKIGKSFKAGVSVHV